MVYSTISDPDNVVEVKHGTVDGSTININATAICAWSLSASDIEPIYNGKCCNVETTHVIVSAYQCDIILSVSLGRTCFCAVETAIDCNILVDVNLSRKRVSTGFDPDLLSSRRRTCYPRGWTSIYRVLYVIIGTTPARSIATRGARIYIPNSSSGMGRRTWKDQSSQKTKKQNWILLSK